MNDNKQSGYGPTNYNTIKKEINAINELIGNPSNPAEGTIYSDINALNSDINDINELIGDSTDPAEGTIYSDIKEINDLIGDSTDPAEGTIYSDINALDTKINNIDYGYAIPNGFSFKNVDIVYGTADYTITSGTIGQINQLFQFNTTRHGMRGKVLWLDFNEATKQTLIGKDVSFTFLRPMENKVIKITPHNGENVDYNVTFNAICLLYDED